MDFIDLNFKSITKLDNAIEFHIVDIDEVQIVWIIDKLVYLIKGQITEFDDNDWNYFADDIQNSSDIDTGINTSNEYYHTMYDSLRPNIINRYFNQEGIDLKCISWETLLNEESSSEEFRIVIGIHNVSQKELDQLVMRLALTN